ncbi:hypothetical protein ACFWRV_34210 [Streptomyces sp. NPDC058576]
MTSALLPEWPDCPAGREQEAVACCQRTEETSDGKGGLPARQAAFPPSS